MEQSVLAVQPEQTRPPIISAAAQLLSLSHVEHVCPGPGVSGLQGDADTREAAAGAADRRVQFGSHHITSRSFLRELCKGRGHPSPDPTVCG